MNKATKALLVAGGVGLGASLVSGDASAQDLGFDLSGVQGSIGGGIALEPEYLGGDEQELTFLPLIDVSYNNVVFLRYDNGVNLNPVQGIGYNIISTPNIKAGANINYVFGREADDADFLAGTQDIDESLEVGIFGEFAFDFFKFDASYRVDLADGHDGQVLETGFSMGAQFSPRLTVVGRLGAKWGNQDYNSTIWGTNAGTPAAALTPDFNPEAGWEHVSLGVTSKYKIAQNFSILGHARWVQFVDVADESPLAQESYNIVAGVGLTYDF